ncbi:MAG: hypothetical protein ACPHW0_08065 [Pseudomonadales bacterium]|jgi:hypothetical protein
MNNAELTIIALNFVVIFSAYFFVYPKYCGANGYRIAFFDLILKNLVFLISASLFWDEGGAFFWGIDKRFSLLIFSVNWFWFTFITYLIIDSLFSLWFYNKHKA